ncbi:MAG: cold shock domain-containing protein [Deltaproteobacteria bacterium]|nr:cold shock domain-containing protein [Deltaproteobacteria bacterium]
MAATGGGDASGVRTRGTVKWFDDVRGFGFISPEDGSGDIFVHHTSVITDGYQTLMKGQPVEFLLTQGPRGPVAQNVRVVSS